MNTAVLSDDGLHRLRLERDTIAERFRGEITGRTAAYIMVNPSTAGVEENDATIRKLLGFSSRLGFVRFIVGNKFTFRTKDIDFLGSNSFRANHADADKHIEQILRDADFHIAAWGSLNKLPKVLQQRWKDIVRIADRVGCKLHCIGSTAQDGHPRHPLMLGYDLPIGAWKVPFIANRMSGS